jgi:hypothetical protein
VGLAIFNHMKDVAHNLKPPASDIECFTLKGRRQRTATFLKPDPKQHAARLSDNRWRPEQLDVTSSRCIK